jgi:prepilin peptidase CpaA
MGIGEIFAFGCIFVFTAIGLVSDLKTRKLPNKLTVPACCVGLLYHAIHGYCLSGFSGAAGELGFALMGFAVGFGIMVALWLLGGVAAGDVKFMGALGCWLGTWLIVQVFVLSALLSTSVAAVSAVKKTFQLKRLPRAKSDARAERQRKKKEAEGWMPPLRTRDGWQVAFGVSIAVVTWVLLALELAGMGLQWPK